MGLVFVALPTYIHESGIIFKTFFSVMQHNFEL